MGRNATHFHHGFVDVLDKSFNLVTLSSGQFTDSNIPAGFAPFGIKNIGGTMGELGLLCAPLRLIRR